MEYCSISSAVAMKLLQFCIKLLFNGIDVVSVVMKSFIVYWMQFSLIS